MVKCAAKHRHTLWKTTSLLKYSATKSLANYEIKLHLNKKHFNTINSSYWRNNKLTIALK